jgi:putative adenylate-forming enzyme
MTPPADIIRRCNEAGANVIIGPPSVLRLLVPELGGLRRRLRLVISAAEVLHPEDARRLAGAFGCPVHQIYQTTEGPIASSCPHGSLHVNEDLLRVELLDAEGRPVTRPGERSAKVLVTNLYQDIHPLVRYRMGDQVILGPPCRCGSGFRVIQEVVGRDDDVLWLKRRDGALQPVFPDLFSRWIITYNDAVREFQVIQADPGRLELHLRLDAGFDGRDRAAFLAGLEARLRGELGTYGCGGAAELALEFPAGGDFIQEPGGKFKRFIRGFPAG